MRPCTKRQGFMPKDLDFVSKCGVFVSNILNKIFLAAGYKLSTIAQKLHSTCFSI